MQTTIPPTGDLVAPPPQRISRRGHLPRKGTFVKSLILLTVGVALALVARGVTPAGALGTFAPTDSVTLSSNSTSANANIDTAFTLPGADIVPGTIVNLAPQAACIAPGCGSDPLLGQVAGVFTATPRFGIANGACNSPVFVNYILFSATTDNSAANVIKPTRPEDAAPSGPDNGSLAPLRKDVNTVGNGNIGNSESGSAVSPANGLPGHVDRYPSYLNTLLDPDGPGAALPVVPLARYSGGFQVAGEAWIMNLVVFSPGALAAFAPSHPLSDLASTIFGYASLYVFQDPTVTSVPVLALDVCGPWTTNQSLYGMAKENPCRVTPASCTTDAAINSPTPGADTANARYRNPVTAGTHHFGMFAQSLRDLDDDGNENALDTCPYAANTDGDPRATNGPDSDMLDGVCDPNNAVGNGNEDGDVAVNGAAWPNADDNCPLDPNTTNAEAELAEPPNIRQPRGGPPNDEIGDACDTAESNCADAVDNDLDRLMNDGCAASGAAEDGCLNVADDDGDTVVNDSCPSSSRVANGRYFTVFTLLPRCIGGTDSDGDGWCLSGSVADPNDGNATRTPEVYGITRLFPVAHSGSGANPPASRQPLQACNDGLDNDGDGLIDLDDGLSTSSLTNDDCRPPFTVFFGADTDGDGFSDAAEIHLGTDPLGRCEVGLAIGAIGFTPSTDWPADLRGTTFINSQDRVNNIDSYSYAVPTPRLWTSPGDAGFDRRWDLYPGTSFGKWINILDAWAMQNSQPPMFGGATLAFDGPVCTAHATYND